MNYNKIVATVSISSCVALCVRSVFSKLSKNAEADNNAKLNADIEIADKFGMSLESFERVVSVTKAEILRDISALSRKLTEEFLQSAEDVEEKLNVERELVLTVTNGLISDFRVMLERKIEEIVGESTFLTHEERKNKVCLAIVTNQIENAKFLKKQLKALSERNKLALENITFEILAKKEKIEVDPWENVPVAL